jgi:heat shock 70kDa protein 1/2/6/8
MAQQTKDKAIGIDLGTTYSCVAVYENNNVTVIANDQGNRTTPSYVSFFENERLIGDAAKNQASANPKNTIYDVKRLIGREYSDRTVQDDAKHFSFDVTDSNGKPMVQVEVDGKRTQFTPEQVSAMILQKMKTTAEAYLGYTVKDAVITVPAYFNEAQRQATKDAGLIAGLNVMRIINEPTAAAIAYGLGKETNEGQDHNVLIFDLGGGTFDVSVLSIDDGVFEVKSTSGDTHLGGSDFDQLITDYLLDEFVKKNAGKIKKEDVSDRAKLRLRTMAERAKRTLSSSTSANIEIDSLCDGLDFATKLTRARFEALCGDLFKKTIVSVERALIDSGLGKQQINEIVLVGGSTRIPKVKQILSDYFNGKKLCESINPDEAVAYGAAVQAAILNGDATGKADKVLLIDVTPLSLGIETSGEVMTKIIDRNTAVPCKKSQIFSTYSDNQPAVTIQIYQGERSRTADNKKIGQFELGGIPPAKRGVPQIEVCFDLDSNGMLLVTAKDKATNKECSVTIQSRDKLSQSDIDRMVEEAEKFAELDKQNMAKIEAKNSLETRLFGVKSLLDEHKDKLTSVDQTKLDDLNKFVTETEQWLNEVKNSDTSKEVYEEKSKRLDELSHPITTELYKGGAQGGMPDMSGMTPEQMAAFMGGMDKMGADDDDEPKAGPKVEEVD